MEIEDAKINLLAHSEAKVQLYGTYLSTYLNMLSRVPSVKHIYLFDLLCGEGIYDNNEKGSPLIAIDKIQNHFYTNNKTCPNMTIWFNDSELSNIEPKYYKIERVKRFCHKFYLPKNVRIEYFKEDYDTVCSRAIDEVKNNPVSKNLFFVDPYGYKEIKLSSLDHILANHNSEVLLFLPISFMYRFAEKAQNSEFSGGKPLKDFLTALFGSEQKYKFRSAYDFIEKVKEKLREHFRSSDVFVDTFTIDRGHGNVYCLFFFTSHVRGYEKMLEAKWKLDVDRGLGYSEDGNAPKLFSEIELRCYPEKLEKFIKSAPMRTNHEIYRFGLDQGFLPKHTNKILSEWKDDLSSFEVKSLDGKPIRGFYIAYNHDRRVGFRFK